MHLNLKMFESAVMRKNLSHKVLFLYLKPNCKTVFVVMYINSYKYINTYKYTCRYFNKSIFLCKILIMSLLKNKNT